jgi:hypothetical protein
MDEEDEGLDSESRHERGRQYHGWRVLERPQGVWDVRIQCAIQFRPEVRCQGKRRCSASRPGRWGRLSSLGEGVY